MTEADAWLAGHGPMRLALALAEAALGTTWPNPAVGCVLTRGRRVVGLGATAPGGRPHAETQALEMAGEAARGATAWITLEPCAHHGQTPPCADALIAAGIARAIIAAQDPDPRTNGAGAARLRGAGVACEEALPDHRAEARSVISGFTQRIRAGRPLITLKLATTLDGRIATRTGESRWITGEPARRLVHAERGRHDAVLIGIGTALADAPALTCRIPGYTRRLPVRIVADSALRLPPASPLAATARQAPVWVLHAPEAPPARAAALAAAGVTCLAVPGAARGLDPAAMLATLGERGLTTVLVEGGAALAASLLAADLVDRLLWCTAPAVLGGDAHPAVGPLHHDTMAPVRRFTPLAHRVAGPDMIGIFARS